MDISRILAGPYDQQSIIIFKSFLFSTLFLKGDGLFDWKCTTGGEGTRRAGFGTGSWIGSSCLNQIILIIIERFNSSLTSK
jgi:hypothetical protein